MLIVTDTHLNSQNSSDTQKQRYNYALYDRELHIIY